MLPFLCIDGATRLGWALRRQETVEPRSGVVRIAEIGARLGRFGLKANEWLSDFLAVTPVAKIYYEVPILGGHDNADTALKLYGLACLVETIAEIRGIPVERMNNQTVKRFFAGTGRAKDVDMIRACHARGWNPSDDNEADALGMLCLAEHQLGIRRDHGRLFTGTAA
ncbi:hypothetical protein STAQ_27920 [Allostella sp. ATCC 35155]|nr:hypothetical protein STAQ_27920 [Stella sp. ATCC 35155]